MLMARRSEWSCSSFSRMLMRPRLLLFLALFTQVLRTQCRPINPHKEGSPQRPILQAGLPANRTAVVGSDVEFKCKVLGDPRAHIQWLKHIEVNGNSVGPDGLPYVRVLKAAGPNTTDKEMEVLQLKSVSLDDAGEYTCLVGNRVGVSHHSAWLTVVEEGSPHRPILQAGLPANHTAVVGSDVEFKCKVLGDPRAHIQWLKHIKVNGSRVGPDGLPYVRVLKTAGPNTTVKEMEVLQLKSVSLDDAGEYTCLVGNTVGFSHHSAWLTVVEAGEKKRVDTMQQSPPCRIQNQATTAKTRPEDTASTPPEGSPHRPILQAGLPADCTAVVGSDVELECKVLGDPRAHIQWLKHIKVNGNSVGPDGLPYVRVLKPSGPNTTDKEMEVLRLRNVSLDDAGEYTCLAGNSVGFSHHSAWLTVVEGEPEVKL
ncbi:fibroblast growth factor receptor 1-like isoform X1 [Pagrus major]|uniref:fibroblast growth factor receptor 1-like isoform X1 n=1 Tax=Pagrus major TaxID=143350 RepID=UPI003CC8408A